MTQHKIGTRVITRKFEGAEVGMIKYFDKEGIVTSSTAHYAVHGCLWPPSAVEPIDPPFQPEYGKEYEFKFTNPDRWNKATFVGYNPNKRSQWKYIAMINEDDPQPFEFIRPIARTLESEIEDAIAEMANSTGQLSKVRNKIMQIIRTHTKLTR